MLVPNQNIYRLVTLERKRTSLIRYLCRTFTTTQHLQQSWLLPQPLLKLSQKLLFTFYGTFVKEFKTRNYCTFLGLSMFTSVPRNFFYHTASSAFRERNSKNLAMGPPYHLVSSLHFSPICLTNWCWAAFCWPCLQARWIHPSQKKDHWLPSHNTGFQTWILC